MQSNKIFYGFFIFLLSTGICLFWEDHTLYGSDFMLDEETVFCLYYKISGEYMDDQDMEDLSYELGRPLFTVFKPSEMFTKQSLKNLRTKLMKKIAHYGDDSLFQWKLKHDPLSDIRLRMHGIVEPIDSGMPQPTPYIRSEISKKGRDDLIRQLTSIARERVSGRKKDIRCLDLYFKPVGIEYRFEKRNVAREDMVLPIRYVIFTPVKVVHACQ